MTKPKKDTNLSELVYIIDRSGSMSGMEEAAVESFNQFVDEQQKVEGDAVLTQVLFDTEFEKPVDACPIGKVPKMEPADFRPGGCTALLDAIGLSIKTTRQRLKAMPEAERPATVVFAIFTDGQENSSRRYTWSKIAAKIKRRTDQDGWQFLFLAANQDAIATASKMNIARDNAANVDFCEAGVSSQGAAFNRKASALRRHSAGLFSKSVSDDLRAPLSDITAEEHEKKAASGRKRNREEAKS